MSNIYRGPDKSSDCASCPCAINGAPARAVRGGGTLNSLAIVGEAPSTNEVAQGWPFVGESGKLLQEMLNQNGIDRNSIWITNALLCQRPSAPEKLAIAVECCRPRLQHELGLVSPQTVLALGSTAARALHLPITAITDARGTVQASTLTEAPVFTSIHPAAILRGGAGTVKGGGKQKMNVDAQAIFLKADIGKAYRTTVEYLPGWQDNINLFYEFNAASMALVGEFLGKAMQAPIIAIDLEWNKHGQITWLGLALVERAISIYLPNMGLPNLLHHSLRTLGENESLPKLFHNLQADIPIWESQIGPINGQVEDTMLLHHAAYPGAAHDLQQVTSQLLIVPPWKALRGNEEKAHIKHVAAKQRAEAKALKQLEHQARNQASKEGAVKRKRERIAKHDAQNTTAHILKLLSEK